MTNLIARLSKLKIRLGLLQTDLQHDEMLTAFLEALTERFDRECSRQLLRAEDRDFEFAADQLEIRVPAYPIERLARFEVKEDEASGWVAVPEVAYVIRNRCVLSLQESLGSHLEQARVIYSGGYVAPGEPPAPGQTPLPADLEHAAVEQAAFWFQNRERLGLLRSWDYQSTYRHFSNEGLLPVVSRTLERYERWTL